MRIEFESNEFKKIILAGSQLRRGELTNRLERAGVLRLDGDREVIDEFLTILRKENVEFRIVEREDTAKARDGQSGMRP